MTKAITPHRERLHMINLKTTRLTIRDPKPSDLTGWHSLLSDPKTMYYLQDIMTYTIEESQKNLETAITEAKSPNRKKYFFTIEHTQTGEFIGSIGYTVTKTTPLGNFVGAGYFILPKHQGQGYVTEALHEVLRFAFEENNVFKLETGCMAENKASERIMQKCGLIKEAERKQQEWHDGQMKDRVEYRLLKQEWQAKKIAKPQHFWQALNKLISESNIVIDRPKGTPHPRYPNSITPLNYGYLQNTTSMDGGGIDLWQGTSPAQSLDAIICTVDLKKRDSEIKLLIGCTEEEKTMALKAHNETASMKGILIRQGF